MKLKNNLLIPLLIIILFILLSIIILNKNTSHFTIKASADQCKKLGINLANYTPTQTTNYDRAHKLNMGYALEIANTPDQLPSLVNSFKYANSKGITPILRACVSGQRCDFSNPAVYINLINALAKQLGPNNQFYAIAGPNEPNSENWTGGNSGDYLTIAPPLAEFMNKIIAGVSQPNVKLLSPAFNTSEPNFSNLIKALKANNANFSALYAIAGNAYDISGTNNISDYTTLVKNVEQENGFADKPIILTEIGMLDTDALTRPGALKNLSHQINLLSNDEQVLGYLLFNSFGTNPSGGFSYNVLSDDDFQKILTPSCLTLPAISTLPIMPPSAPVDNSIISPKITISISYPNKTNLVSPANQVFLKQNQSELQVILVILIVFLGVDGLIILLVLIFKKK